MTTLGHSITGLAALTLCLPPQLGGWRRWLWVVLFIALANIPDWPLPFWGHHQLAVSHSLWVNLAICSLVATCFYMPALYLPNRERVILCGASAWLSHLLLDTLYGDLPGVAIYWPFSNATAALPLPWLKPLGHVPPPFDAAVIHILLLEALTFTPLLLVAFGFRRKWPPSTDLNAQ